MQKRLIFRVDWETLAGYTIARVIRHTARGGAWSARLRMRPALLQARRGQCPDFRNSSDLDFGGIGTQDFDSGVPIRVKFACELRNHHASVR